MIYERLLYEKQKNESQIQTLQNQLANLPEGNLICARNGTRYKWYQSDGHNKKYLPKSERQTAEQLAYKKYLSTKLNNLLIEQKSINSYFKTHQTFKQESEETLFQSPGFNELLSPFFSPLSQELQEWISAPYEKNKKNPENLIHKAYSGIHVRSKSEMLIDMFLYLNKIPFRYECLLQLGDLFLFPDFTIRHPKTGQLFYWEHFGMMDNLNYSRNVCHKVQQYISHGIIPTIQLITTYETKDNPLLPETVEKIIYEYFLN